MILSEARHSSEIDTLSKKINDFETLIAVQRLEIMELRVNNQNDHETNNCNIELLEQIDDTNVEQTFEAIKKDLSSEFPETLSALRLSVGLSLRNCIITLVIVGNYCFSQKWKLPKVKNINRASGPERCLPPDARSLEVGTEKFTDISKWMGCACGSNPAWFGPPP